MPSPAGKGKGQSQGKAEEGKGKGKGGQSAKAAAKPPPTEALKSKAEVKVYSEADIDTYSKKGRTKIPLMDCCFDTERKFGQPRVLKSELYTRYLHEMLASHPPRVPYAEALVWHKGGV